MYFPWPGLFEQIKLADVFVHYDDVQLPQGRSFMNRVQLKTPSGQLWMTVPIKKKHRGLQIINRAEIDDSFDWRAEHKEQFRSNYASAPYFQDAFSLLSRVLDRDYKSLADLTIESVEVCAEYLGLRPQFVHSSQLNILGASSARLLNLVKHLGGDIYITGHGAKNYLDHDMFESDGVRVEYIDYQKTAYPQRWGDFIPYVSILDLIANTGKSAAQYLDSPSIPWKDFISSR